MGLLTASAGVQNVHKGAPPTWASRVTVYAAVGPQQTNDKAASDLVERRISVFVEFGYRVAQAEATAEAVLAAYLDNFLVRAYASRKDGFGGVGTNVEFDLSLAASPDYLRVAAQEIRAYPMLIWVTQRDNLTALIDAL